MADIYDCIKIDHALHRNLLKKLAGTKGDSRQRQKWWDQFYYDVKAHAAAEEETFYSKLLEAPKGQDDARHSVAEHKEMDDILEDLNQMEFSSPGWLTRFKTLKEHYEHHMDEEEKEIFFTARKIFSQSDVSRFAERFEVRKRMERKLVDKKAQDALQE